MLDVENQHSNAFYCELALCGVLRTIVYGGLSACACVFRDAACMAKLCVSSLGKRIQFCRIKLNCLALLCVESNLCARRCQTVFTAARGGIAIAAGFPVCFDARIVLFRHYFIEGMLLGVVFVVCVFCLFVPIAGSFR